MKSVWLFGVILHHPCAAAIPAQRRLAPNSPWIADMWWYGIAGLRRMWRSSSS